MQLMGTNNFHSGAFSAAWMRTVTEAFQAQNWSLNVGDEIEFIGQMPERRGEVLIGVGSGSVAVWARAADVAGKSVGRGVYATAQTITLN